jgi:hypothetical protein
MKIRRGEYYRLIACIIIGTGLYWALFPFLWIKMKYVKFMDEKIEIK